MARWPSLNNAEYNIISGTVLLLCGGDYGDKEGR